MSLCVWPSGGSVGVLNLVCGCWGSREKIMEVGGRVAVVDMHWFYIKRTNYIKYVHVEIYHGCQLLLRKNWMVQTPRITSQYSHLDLKTINHVSRYHGIRWTHPGQPFKVVEADVRLALTDVQHIIIHGRLKACIFKDAFHLNTLHPGRRSTITTEAVTLYKTPPERVILEETMFQLRQHYFKSLNLPPPPFLLSECAYIHRNCTVTECYVLSGNKRRATVSVSVATDGGSGVLDTSGEITKTSLYTQSDAQERVESVKDIPMSEIASDGVGENDDDDDIVKEIDSMLIQEVDALLDY